jgi:uncharacterized protein YxjI
MEVEGAEGNRLVMVKKALITPFRDRWTIKIGDGPDLDVQGNILDHEYTFSDGRTPVATVSKKWFRVADTYGGGNRARSEPRDHPGCHCRARHDGQRKPLTALRG